LLNDKWDLGNMTEWHSFWQKARRSSMSLAASNVDCADNKYFFFKLVWTDNYVDIAEKYQHAARRFAKRALGDVNVIKF